MGRKVRRTVGREVGTEGARKWARNWVGRLSHQRIHPKRAASGQSQRDTAQMGGGTPLTWHGHHGIHEPRSQAHTRRSHHLLSPPSFMLLHDLVNNILRPIVPERRCDVS